MVHRIFQYYFLKRGAKGEPLPYPLKTETNKKIAERGPKCRQEFCNIKNSARANNEGDFKNKIEVSVQFIEITFIIVLCGVLDIAEILTAGP